MSEESQILEKQEKKQKKNAEKTSIIQQVAILFIIAITITASITYAGQKRSVDAYVRSQTENLAQDTAQQVILALKSYPAYEWLLRYWHDHSDTMNVEYDVDYRNGAATRTKCSLWEKNHPNNPLQYVTTAELSVMPAEDQKLFAEIMYTWLITRINQIKASFDVDFLFCVLTDETCREQFFLFSAAEKGATRSTTYGDAFILGTQREVSDSQQEAMLGAIENERMLADAGSYVDYYVHMGKLSGKDLFIGLTYGKEDLFNRINAQTRNETLRSVLYQAILVVLALFMLLTYVLRPLRTVQQNIRLYKNTKDSRTVAGNLEQIHSHNEIEELAEDVTDLTQEIDEYTKRIASITKEKERIGTELHLARRIQKSALPSVFPPFPEHKEFDIYATMQPAREVGGDFFDFQMIDDDHLFLTIADVSGKGIPAALFMMITKTMLANVAKYGRTPAEILQRTNEAICANNKEEMFVTVWLGILELSTGKLTAANAGHEYPVIRHKGGRFEVLKDKHGIVLGAMEGLTYSDYEITLEPGACLFVYTDGIPEATNGDNTLFGMERMVEALNSMGNESHATRNNGTENSEAENVSAENNGSGSAGTENADTDNGDPGSSGADKPEDVLDAVRTAVEAFVQDAPQFDDMTMMCLTYAGPEKK